MEFKVYGSGDSTKDAVLDFLNQIDANSLSEAVANSMSWGDGDPIYLAIELLKKQVSEW